MNQGDRTSDAAARGPAASEERIIPGAAEFISTATPATRFFTTIFQALLVAAVALGCLMGIAARSTSLIYILSDAVGSWFPAG